MYLASYSFFPITYETSNPMQLDLFWGQEKCYHHAKNDIDLFRSNSSKFEISSMFFISDIWYMIWEKSKARRLSFIYLLIIEIFINLILIFEFENLKTLNKNSRFNEFELWVLWQLDWDWGESVRRRLQQHRAAHNINTEERKVISICVSLTEKNFFFFLFSTLRQQLCNQQVLAGQSNPI